MNITNTDCKMKRFIYTAAICILALASCTGPYETDFDFCLDRDECRFPADSGQSYFRVFGEGKWTATFEQEVEWLSIDKAEGMGESQVLVFHKKNEGLSRGVNLFIDHEDGTRKTIYMSQKSGLGTDKPAYSLASETIKLLNLSMSTKVMATSNVSAEAVDSAHVKIIYAGTDTTWLSDVKISPESLVFSAASNESGAERTATIEVSFNGAVWAEPYTVFLNIIQGSAGPEVSLEDSYELDPLGTKTLEISIGTNWDTGLYSYDVSDFSISDESFLRSVEFVDSTSTLKVLPSMNKTKDARTATLTWNAKDSAGSIVSTASTTLSQDVSPIQLDGDPVNLTEGGRYANCYILPDAGDAYYSLEPKLVSGNLPAEDITDAKLLWQTAESVLEYVAYSPLEGIMYIYKPAGAKGSAIVALTSEDGTIRWSLHFWATGESVGECTIGGVTFMDRNIGATADTAPVNGENDAAGMHYQWGRKDPFPTREKLTTNDNGDKYTCQTMAPVYPEDGVRLQKDTKGVTLDFTIENPGTYIWNGTSDLDWSNPQNNEYWKPDHKTDYDPCPYGYTVPSKENLGKVATAIGKASSAYAGRNLTCDDGSSNFWCYADMYMRNENTATFTNNVKAYYWSSTTDGKLAYYLNDASVTTGSNMGRRIGIAVRCVKANNQ